MTTAEPTDAAMKISLLALGSLVLAATILDAIWTTISPGVRSGPISGKASRGTWRLIHRLPVRGGSRVLVWSGPAILVGTLFGWVALLATGWTMIFSAEPAALLNTRTTPKTPADLTGTIWFVVYTMFSVGNGDFYPPLDGYQIAASFTTITGMMLITVAVTYILNVVSAVTRKRSFATDVFSLGPSGPQMVANSWNGKDLGRLGTRLLTFASDLSDVTEKDRAYPLLHFYHAPMPALAMERAICALDDVLLVLDAIPDEHRPTPDIMRTANQAIETYLDVAESAYLDGTDDLPPWPRLDPVRDAGLTTPGGQTQEGLPSDRVERRQKLLAMVSENNWDWPTA